MDDFFSRGILAGFLLTAPIRPFGAMCMKRAINGGQLIGFVSGLGRTTAEAIFGILVAFGLTFTVSIFSGPLAFIGALGGLYLIYLSIETINSAQVPIATPDSSTNLGAAFFAAFGLTLNNATALRNLLGVFAAVGIGASTVDFFDAALLTGGVFVGSAVWWLLLTTTCAYSEKKLEPTTIIWIGRLSGLALGIWGVAAMLRAVGV